MSSAVGAPSKKFSWVKKMEAKVKTISGAREEPQQGKKRDTSKPAQTKENNT
jgi:hypothetical protein